MMIKERNERMKEKEAIKQFARYLIGMSDRKGRIYVSDLPDFA